MLEIKNLTKSFGDVLALDHFSLDLKKGEVLGLLGPNGAGKTTMLSLIAGLRAPSSGTVRLFGRDPRDSATRERLGTTPQQTALPEALRVREVLDYVAAHYAAPGARDELIAEFDLGELLGGDARANAAEVRAVLAGAGGPVRDAVVLNAAGAIVAHAGLSSRAEWLPAWEDGLRRAAAAIDSGAAEQLLARWVRFGREL